MACMHAPACPHRPADGAHAKPLCHPAFVPASALAPAFEGPSSVLLLISTGSTMDGGLDAPHPWKGPWHSDIGIGHWHWHWTCPHLSPRPTRFLSLAYPAPETSPHLMKHLKHKSGHKSGGRAPSRDTRAIPCRDASYASFRQQNGRMGTNMQRCCCNIR